MPFAEPVAFEKEGVSPSEHLPSQPLLSLSTSPACALVSPGSWDGPIEVHALGLEKEATWTAKKKKGSETRHPCVVPGVQGVVGLVLEEG